MNIINNFWQFNSATNEKITKDFNKILKSYFSGQITLNFMLETMYSMLKLYPDLQNYINQANETKKILIGDYDNLYFVLCEHIISTHKSRIIFLTNEERSELENDKEYRDELMNDVYKQIRLRQIIDIFFRKKQIHSGDKFIYFPIPYYLLVITARLLELCPKSNFMSSIYLNIANNSLAVLSLLQDNLMGPTYSICRTIIEEYIKATILHNCKEAIKEYSKFLDYELNHSLTHKYEDEFVDKYNNRLFKKITKKIDYLHYGWVDCIPNYHEIIKEHPYTFGSVKKFICEKFNNKETVDLFDSLEYYHNMCHGYIHGSIIISKYPLLHYFEICSILLNTTASAYCALCEKLGEDTKINGIDVIAEIQKHNRILADAYNKISTEAFEDYYKNINY